MKMNDHRLYDHPKSEVFYDYVQEPEREALILSSIQPKVEFLRMSEAHMEFADS